MVKRKLNVKRLGVFGAIILLILVVAIIGIKNLIEENKLRQTVEYKLEEVGYSTNEIKVIKSSLNENQVNDIIDSKYKRNLTKFLKEKFFDYDNLERYLDYYNNNSSLSPSKVVAIVNTGADEEWYTDVKETDTSKGTLMIVNKFYGLPETYEPEDLVLVSSSYAYSGKYVSKSIYDALINMLDAAREEGYTLVVSQGYRSYADQAEAYKDIQDASGTSVADSLAARAGHSEYQTGLGVVVEPYNKVVEDVTNNLEHQWIMNNCYRYGFILRYPEDSKDITGFNYDEWRLRYVGVDASTKMHQEGITFDEYYEYYVK